jgi:hypothetical protein
MNDGLKTLRNAELSTEVERLRTDIANFKFRAEKAAVAAKLEGRCPIDDPLRQRLVSIRDYLDQRLRQAEDEIARRDRGNELGRTGSFRATLAKLTGTDG